MDLAVIELVEQAVITFTHFACFPGSPSVEKVEYEYASIHSQSTLSFLLMRETFIRLIFIVDTLMMWHIESYMTQMIITSFTM